LFEDDTAAYNNKQDKEEDTGGVSATEDTKTEETAKAKLSKGVWRSNKRIKVVCWLLKIPRLKKLPMKPSRAKQ